MSFSRQGQWGVKNSGDINIMRIIDMGLERNQQTTIAISKKNHLELSGLCKKGQSFDSILTEVLRKLKENEENKDGQSKFGVGRSATLTSRFSSIQTTTNGSDLNYE